MLTTLLFVAGWLVGLVAGDSGVLSLWPAGGAASIGLAGAIVGWRWPAARRIFLIVLGLGLGAGRLLLTQTPLDADRVAAYRERGPVIVRGVVAERPDILADEQRLRLRVSHIRGDGFDLDVAGDALVYTDGYPRYVYGDELELAGDLLAPPRLDAFDYPRYLARQGIEALLRRPKIEVIGQGRGSALWAAVYRFKDHVTRTVVASLPAPGGALLAGMLLGDRSGIPADLGEAFRVVGVSHILVISGWNVAILAGAVTSLCVSLVGRRPALWIAATVVLLYTALVGFDPPVVRAAIMGCLALAALQFGRQALALHSLGLAALAMTAWRPYSLWDLGFQLSFAATAGLILFAKPIEAGLREMRLRLIAWAFPKTGQRRWQQWIAPLGRLVTGLAGAGGSYKVAASGRLLFAGLLRDTLVATLAAQIFVIPLLVYRLNEISWLTVLANLLILPLLPATMGLGALAALAGLLWQPLGWLLGWAAWPFLAYMTAVTEWLAGLPWALAHLPPLSQAFLLAYYAAFIGLALLLRQGRDAVKQTWLRARRRLPTYAGYGALGIAVILIWAGALTLPDGKLHVYVLDVGQGDAILVQTPTGRRLLVDGGPDGPTLLAALGRRLPFWARRLDVVLATHADADHTDGLFAALGRYSAGVALDAGFAAGSEIGRRWEESLAQSGARRVAAVAGARIAVSDGVMLEILHPPDDVALEGNAASVVARLTYADFSLLLTGDLEVAGEEVLLHGGQPLASNVLKVAHHGAATGTSAAFLQAVAPAVAVISVGAGNTFGHPATSTLHRLEDAGATVWRTDQAGEIEIISDGAHLWIRGRR